MQLAPEILAWLSIDFLLPRLWLQPKLLGGDPAVLRARIVNDLSESELRRLLAEVPSFLEPFDQYLRVSTFQGELSDVGPLFVESRYLLRRALALADFRWSWYFSGLSRLHPEVEWALLTDDPRIWARALSLVDLGHASEIEDLFGVFQRRPKLRAYYQKLFREEPRRRWNAAESMLAGYIGALTVRQAQAREASAAQHVVDFDGDIISYPGLQMGAFIRGHVLGRRDFADPDDPDNPVLLQYAQDYVSSGWMPSGIAMSAGLELAIAQNFRREIVQPETVSNIAHWGLAAVPLVRVLTPRDFQRAREMLSFCRRNGQAGPIYLTFLQIICGENIDLNWLSLQDLATRSRLELWMISVGHPQLSNPVMGLPVTVPISRELYAPEKIVQLFGDNTPEELKLRLFAQGQALRYRHIFPEWTQRRTWLEETKPGPLGRPSYISGYPQMTTTFLEYAAHYRRRAPNFEWPLLPEQVQGVASVLRIRPPKELLPEIARLEQRYQEILAQLQ